jgi:acyl-CoA reductase-like NAD-dependent aldehyde dehydrogenase
VDEADFIQFTGSARTGRKIAQRAAGRLIPYSLELGGKDAMIVLADADLQRAANAAVWGAMFNSGQTCTSVERVFVEEPVYDEFVARVARRVRGLRQRAGGKRFDADVGSLSSEASSPSSSGTCPRRWPAAHARSSAASEPTGRGRSSSRPCSWTSTSR